MPSLRISRIRSQANWQEGLTGWGLEQILSKWFSEGKLFGAFDGDQPGALVLAVAGDGQDFALGER